MRTLTTPPAAAEAARLAACGHLLVATARRIVCWRSPDLVGQVRSRRGGRS